MSYDRILSGPPHHVGSVLADSPFRITLKQVMYVFVEGAHRYLMAAETRGVLEFR